MANKCEMKQYLADECEKDRRAFEQRCEQLQAKVKEMTQQNELFDKLQQLDNKAQWALHTRKSLPDAE